MGVYQLRSLTHAERAILRDWALADARAEVRRAEQQGAFVAEAMDLQHGGWYHDLVRPWYVSRWYRA